MRHEFWITAVAATLSLSIAALAQGTPGIGAPGAISGSGGSAGGGAAGAGGIGGSGGSGTTRSGPSSAPTGGTLGTSAPSTAGPTVGTTSSLPSGSGAINLSAAQHTQIMRSFAGVKPLPAINFAIAIGAVIPATVELHEVPPEAAQVVPAYTGHSYFTVANQIVIVEPRARRIVAVLPRTG